VIRWAACSLAVLISALLVWYFHDRYWYPTDDGLYAHIAERLLSGEVLNRDIQDIHPGYIHFLHAAAFRMFGLDMLSLRYPLVLAAIIQSSLVAALLSRRSVAMAAAGSVAVTAIGVIQFVDPTPNWYCLTLSTLLAYWLTSVPITQPARLFGAGALVGVLALFRQLSGVWAAMAVIVLALLEEGRQQGLSLLGRAILLILLAATVGYLVLSRNTEPGGLLLIAVWPVAILVWLLIKIRVSDSEVVARLARLAAGGAVPVLPLLVYHIAHGSVGPWIRDNVFAAAGETTMSFFESGWYGALPLVSAYQVITSADLVRIANGLYWLVLPLLSAVNGILILNRLQRRTPVTDLAVPIVASFYAMVSLYLEGPLYLYYSAGLSLVALLWFAGMGSPRLQRAGAALALAVAVIAVVFHAGQPPERTSLQILRGDRLPTVSASSAGLDRCTLHLPDNDRVIYQQLVNLIQQESGPGDAILAIPNDAELYFLARRRNPTRFYNSALGLRSPEDISRVMHAVDQRLPRVVVYRPGDKYNNAASEAILNAVRLTFVRIDTIGGREIYGAP
jgi:hypothetical protein